MKEKQIDSKTKTYTMKSWKEDNKLNSDDNQISYSNCSISTRPILSYLLNSKRKVSEKSDSSKESVMTNYTCLTKEINVTTESHMSSFYLIEEDSSSLSSSFHSSKGSNISDMLDNSTVFICQDYEIKQQSDEEYIEYSLINKVYK